MLKEKKIASENYKTIQEEFIHMSKQPNKFNKLVATAAGAAVVASAIVPATAGAAWTNSPDWMKGSLQDLVNYGVIDANSTANAAGEVTRGEVASYFAKALKLDLQNVTNPGFADVPTSHPYYNAIAALANAGKMNGTEKGFEPDRVINRAEMASLLVKAFDYKYGNGDSLKFTDLKGSEWAKNAIAGLTEAGIKLGVSDSKFAPTSKLTRQDTVGFLWKVMKDQGIDFTATEEVAKEVASVTAVTTKGVDVVFDKVTEAREGATITVKDPNGNEVAVKPVNLEIGDTEVSFTFEKELDKLELGTWMVGGVEFDTAAVAAVEKVLDAKNQVELYAALTSSYFTKVKADNIVDYQTAISNAKDADKDSVADIQKIIDTVNNDIVTVADKEAAVTAVKDAKNQLQLLNALKQFKRVNADWINDYQGFDSASNGADLTTDLGTDVAAAYDKVQQVIDAVDVAKVRAAITDAEAGLDAAKVTTAKDLVNQYIEADDEENNDTEKADYLKRLDVHAALINITTASTNAQLQNAFNAYYAVDENFNKDLVNDTLLREYRTAIAAKAVAQKNTIDGIEATMNEVHNTAITNAIVDINGLSADATDAAVKAALQKLADVSKTTAEPFKMETVFDASLALYKADLIGHVTTQAEVEAVINDVNDPVAELNAVRDANTTDAKVLLNLLKAPALTLTNLVEANKDAYLKDVAKIQDAITDGTAVPADLAKVKKAVDEINAVVEFNGATTASNAKKALDKYAVATANTDYINLSTTAKLEVAELVLADKPSTGFENSAALVAEITEAIGNRAAMLTAVNTTAGFHATISVMDTALETLNYDAYKNLTDVEQIAVAEAFINNFPTTTVNDVKTQTDYTTLTAIKADIDKAISQVK